MQCGCMVCLLSSLVSYVCYAFQDLVAKKARGWGWMLGGGCVEKYQLVRIRGKHRGLRNEITLDPLVPDPSGK